MARRPARSGSDVGALTLLAAVAVIATVSALLWTAMALADAPGFTGGNPVAAAIRLADGKITWTGSCTLWLVVELAPVALVAAGVLWWRARHPRTRVDSAARRMASRRDVAHLGPAAVAASARRLRPGLGDGPVDPDQTGVLVGYTLAGGMPLRQSWEDMAVDIWGPRTGKTTSRAIPAIVAAPGPVVVTSVKGDIVDATRDIRAARGQVWVFDPQHILDQPQALWWNPLAPIATITDARRLAEHFAAAEREPGIQRDAFFDPSSEELVANLLLAAAAGDRTILEAYRWSVNPRDDEPARLLAEHGFDLPADAVNGAVNLPDKTRGGVYAGAQKMLMCLTEPSVTAWVTPPSVNLPRLDPGQLVTQSDTLYLLSQGGPGSPAPLIAALTDAVLRAGELRARASAGHRLDPPLLGVLDEAANICRIRQLPALYSYYGSHGLPIITILQSYAQGVDVWGREGMRKLWSAANVRTYGGGVADAEFLDELAKLIGEHDVTTRSTSTARSGWGERSISHNPRRQRILDISDLHALPRGRMVVYSSGAPPVLARTAPWQNGPHAEAIRASLAHWDPQDQHTDWTLDDTKTPEEPPR